MARFYLGLGSNIGDRARHLEYALRALSRHGTVLARSPLVETEPVDCPAGGLFLNACLCLATRQDPEEVLAAAMRIESDRGRRRSVRNEPRSLDIDILLVDDRTIDSPRLVVPHPRMCQRRFVLQPLAAIAPGVVHPERMLTIRELLDQCPVGTRQDGNGSCDRRKMVD